MKKTSLLLGVMTSLMLTGSIAIAADSLYVNQDGLVGVGTSSPDKAVHVVGPTGAPEALYKLEHTDAKKVRFALKNPNGAMTFDMTADATAFLISKVGQGEIFRVNDAGQLFLNGVQIH